MTVVGDLLRGLRGLPGYLRKVCPECGRRGWRCTARPGSKKSAGVCGRLSAYLYMLRHWWGIRDMRYRRDEWNARHPEVGQ